MSSTWASVVPAGTVPKDYPRHFDGLSGRPRASVSRRSPRSRAHRGHRAGFVEVGSGGDQGQHIEVSAGHAHQLQGLGLGRTRRPGRPHSGPVSSSTRASVGREPVTAEDCGSDCGAASRAGREHLQGSSPPRSTGGRDGGRGETVRGCVTWGEGVPPFFLDGAAGKAWRPDPGCKRVVGGSWGFAPLSPRRDTSTNRTPHTVWSTPRCGSPEAGRAPR